MVIDKPYQETYRPQFHFTARRGWHNDPNGLVYYEGEYHLFFQHNPHGTDWGNMTWGHAVSPDLVHWRQMEHAIYPDELGTIFSGSGVVDWENTTGFATEGRRPLVCIYTSAGGTNLESQGRPFTQSIAYSLDGGRTFRKYEGNPVLQNLTGNNRDPKVIWHNPTRTWIMALYLDGNEYGLFESPDLKHWQKLQTFLLDGATECPDFFPLPVDNNPTNIKWVFWGANGRYLLGAFDGRTFTPEGETLPSVDNGGNFYAAQTWNDIPEEDGRRIQIAWMAGGSYPNMPFNQQMSFPCVLTLRTTPEGVRLHREPVREIELLHKREHSWTNVMLRPSHNLLSKLRGDLFHIIADIVPGNASEIGFDLRGEKLVYSVAEATLSCLGRSVRLGNLENTIGLEILLDRTSIEVFAHHGYVSMSSCFLPELSNRSLGLYTVGGTAQLRSLKVWELMSAWGDAEEH
ncbi:MAG: glycoside hydrolase family 32 protein [Candidatus Zipacnadales bacterium]